MDHPNVVKFYECFQDKNYLYLVTELITGRTLSDKLAEKGVMPEKEAAGIIKLIVEAMIYFHSADIIHRDLSVQDLLTKIA